MDPTRGQVPTRRPDSAESEKKVPTTQRQRPPPSGVTGALERACNPPPLRIPPRQAYFPVSREPRSDGARTTSGGLAREGTRHDIGVNRDISLASVLNGLDPATVKSFTTRTTTASSADARPLKNENEEIDDQLMHFEEPWQDTKHAGPPLRVEHSHQSESESQEVDAMEKARQE
ncbi:hypothetical protein PV04_02292 [Phialophora macrospora]|uniref:Uncharacterized protein n=1 Tax=Phialophora macrospora TaxID=1851006 RepID=A0A0D2FTX5_9EURO|nr:hypothetical protein PV04_02292 [Phialophora macrospora]